MSRVAKNPIVLPQGVDVAVGNDDITVKGPLGAIKLGVNSAVRVEKEGQSLVCKAVDGVALTLEKGQIRGALTVKRPL